MLRKIMKTKRDWGWFSEDTCLDCNVLRNYYTKFKSKLNTTIKQMNQRQLIRKVSIEETRMKVPSTYLNQQGNLYKLFEEYEEFSLKIRG